MTQMMQAIRYHEHGGAEVLRLEQAPRPLPQTGEVLIRVVAAGVLPIDWKIRKGLFPMPVKFPVIPGTAFAGIVEEVGPDVSGLQIGQEVFGRSTNGTYAEYTTAPAESIALKPVSISFEEAATLSGGATTAWCAIKNANVKPGERVLIHGAAGGVGLFAVQFAKSRGAYVIGTAGPSNMAYIRSIGVDMAIDYTAAPFEQQIEEKVDFVLDTIGGQTLEHSWEVVKHGGALLTIAGQPPLEQGQEEGVRVLRSAIAAKQDLIDIAELMDKRIVQTEVQAVFSLGEAEQAHMKSEKGHGRGRIVLHVGNK
ncbi:NADP-dependent oxidoreductase [Paenibacillus lupini]|uniref:NADP-dependent oxidoreductase n=1 Tax=Paenibacillus lupini TaxID=1450204 RepID=UPI0014224AA2|nr:NADP-dependent oxidoreductase [Paenibacillus lupini]NIK24548.1 NADPH:quinone reductase-like Zn-dependent oxidoreductase [Paenibacillus lupini]